MGTLGKIMARANHTGHIHSGTKNTIMGVSAVFIDGGYLEKVLKHDHGQANIDFAKAVKNEGVLVTLWHGSSLQTRASRELFDLADERRELTADIIRRLRMP